MLYLDDCFIISSTSFRHLSIIVSDVFGCDSADLNELAVDSGSDNSIEITVSPEIDRKSYGNSNDSTVSPPSDSELDSCGLFGINLRKVVNNFWFF